jgi:hypothetical protein
MPGQFEDFDPCDAIREGWQTKLFHANPFPSLQFLSGVDWNDILQPLIAVSPTFACFLDLRGSSWQRNGVATAAAFGR